MGFYGPNSTQGKGNTFNLNAFIVSYRTRCSKSKIVIRSFSIVTTERFGLFIFFLCEL